jgi:hypothetical protein
MHINIFDGIEQNGSVISFSYNSSHGISKVGRFWLKV